MKRLDYDFKAYQDEINGIARRIVSESEEFDAQTVSDQIDEAQVTYNKIRKILNAPEMIKAHAYLYALDMENVDECDRRTVDRLYELGKARGVIQEDEPEKPQEEVGECDDGYPICGGPEDALTGQEMVPAEVAPAKASSSFTVLYSAMKDGQVKTGEYFSSATDQDSARNDCIQNLMPLGYSNIRILGMEQANNAVDIPGEIFEDDSKEYEDQETGAGDGAEPAKENPAKEEEPKKDEPEKKDEPAGDEKQGGEKTAEEKPAEEPEKKDEAPAEGDAEKKDGEKEAPEKNDAEAESEPKKLTPTEKQVLRDEYVGMFKSELQRTKLEKSVEDMNIKEKASFWKTISDKWQKQDPSEFMSDKELEKLYSTVIKN